MINSKSPAYPGTESGKYSDKKFVIIDALAMAYKAYYAFINRPLVTSKGEPTSAVYGFLAQLLKVLEDHKPA